MITKKQKQEIERVMEVSKAYIAESSFMDVLWSDKVGYLYLDIDRTGEKVNDCTCAILKDGEDLFRHIVGEIVIDVGLYNRREESIGPLEEKEIRSRLEAFLKELPEYASVVEEELDD